MPGPDPGCSRSQGQGVQAGAVAQHLHLNMPRRADQFLQIEVPAAEGGAGLGGAACPGLVQLGRASGDAHAPPAAAGEKLGLTLRKVPAQTLEEFDGAFAAMTQERVVGFLAMASPLVVSQGGPLAALALKYRLPGIFPFKENVVAGGLMSYGADHYDLYHRAAVYVDKILKGAKPAELPVEHASKYELVINLKTAKALGIVVPPTVLARADEVIE